MHFEAGVRGLDLSQWMCELRSTVPKRQDYRWQAAFASEDHYEVPGVCA